MREHRHFFIGGEWVEPGDTTSFEVVNPATEAVIGTIPMGNASHVDRAVAAARAAFPAFSETSREERADLLRRMLAAFKERRDEIAEAISDEMGAPLTFASRAQAPMGPAHIKATLAALEELPPAADLGSTRIVPEPIGVCGLITPWNWPINQIACKVVPALAAGCTVVLKPSEMAPLSAYLFAEVLEAAGVPAGAFNLVHGEGAVVGHALAAHPDVDMISFTGSTGAGIEVARAAAPTVKRVTQELGGKSANLILDDADLASAVKNGTRQCMSNSGQSCNAPTRMLVPRAVHDEAVSIAVAAAEGQKVGDPRDGDTRLGPVASGRQFERVQALIGKGVEEGALLATGGTGRPEGLDRGFFVRPTVFAKVTNDMTIAREEIFGPVLVVIPYEDEDDAIRIANDSPYGLSGYVSSGDLERARRVGARLRAGTVFLNGAGGDVNAPFGGYKRSGNGREWGAHGLREFFETKAILGYDPS